MTTILALLHTLNSGRREPQEPASRGTRLATQASTTAVKKQGVCRKLLQMAKNAANTPGIIINVFKLFTRLNNFHLKNKHRAQRFLSNSCRSSERLFSRFYQHDVIWKRVDTCHLQSEARVKSKESTVLHAFSRGKISIKGKEIESPFITTEKTGIWGGRPYTELHPARDASCYYLLHLPEKNTKHFKGRGFLLVYVDYRMFQTKCIQV